MVDGGAGRVIAAIPALEQYVKSHPKEQIRIFVHGWDYLLWSNKVLQPLTFSINDKGTFVNYFKQATDIISPEPYRLPDYINQRVSLSEAFDIIINGKNNNLSVPRLYISQLENVSALKTISQIKNSTKKNKIVVLQPFGSSAVYDNIDGNDIIVDTSNRSMDLLMYSSIVKSLSEDCAIILFADSKFHFKEDTISHKINGDLRTYMALIANCDYFIGCDSVGQHMARAFNKPGTVVFGSTFPENVSYPDWFQIIDKDKENKVYSPLRISEIECNMADRMNEDCMKYSPNEVLNVVNLIKTHINKTA